MNSKLALGWSRVSLRTKLTALSVALIGVLLMISSVGTISLLRTYLQANTDNVLVTTAETLRVENPALIRERIATRQLTLPALPSDYYIAYLDPAGVFLLGIESSTNPNLAMPNVSSLSLPAVQATEGIPFEIDDQGVPVNGPNEGAGWRVIAVPHIGSNG